MISLDVSFGFGAFIGISFGQEGNVTTGFKLLIRA